MCPFPCQIRFQFIEIPHIYSSIHPFFNPVKLNYTIISGVRVAIDGRCWSGKMAKDLGQEPVANKKSSEIACSSINL
jgi:hypothetical protein